MVSFFHHFYDVTSLGITPRSLRKAIGPGLLVYKDLSFLRLHHCFAVKREEAFEWGFWPKSSEKVFSEDLGSKHPS